MQGTVKGGRKQGRQRKKWEENIREWTGLEFGRSQRAVENSEKWRKMVAKSSVVPQRPSLLRDRDDDNEFLLKLTGYGDFKNRTNKLQSNMWERYRRLLFFFFLTVKLTEI